MPDKINIQVEHGVGYIQEFNGTLYIGSKEKFEPMMEWMEKKIELEVQGVGKRYAPLYSQEYKLLNQELKLQNIFDYIDDVKYVKELNRKLEGVLLDFHNIADKKELLNFIVVHIEALEKDIILEVEKLKILENNNKNNELGMDSDWWAKLDESARYGYCFSHIPSQKELILKKEKLFKFLKSNYTEFYKQKLLLVSGEALIGKTHLFCHVALNRIKTKKPTLLFFGNQFKNSKTIIENMVSILGLKPLSEEEFSEALNKWGEEYNTRTLIMIDAINETENSKIWQDGIIKFSEQIKSYSNLALAMSIRDVEKNKIITPENEEYITNEIVEVEHKGFEGIELEAVRTFCEALEVEFPKVPIHTYRLFVNPGMLFLYIETIKNSTKKVDTSIINPLTIFKSYIVDLERKYYQKYMDEVDEEDEVVSEAIEEFISLGTQKDYLHFYLDYKEVKRKLKPLHNKILEFLISEGVLNKLKQDSGTRVYFTYQKFENFFIANYLLNDFETHRDKIGNILFSYENNALVEAFFMQIPQKLGQEPFDLYPNILDEYELCELYFDSLVWREAKYFTDKTFEYINKIQNDWEGISSKYLEVILQLSSIPHHPLNILSFHKYLLSMSMLQRDYEWSLKIHNLFIEEKIVKRIIHWAWDKKEEFEIEDESLYLYGLTLGWFLTSSNRELRDGATKALVNLFTDRVNMFLSVLQSFEMVNDLYVLERLYAVGYGIVLRSENQNGFSNLGEYIYETIFDRDEVVEHILLRDYAKLTVETIDWIISLDVDMSKVLPPYGSSMPNSYPKYEEIESYRAFSSIIPSMRTERLMPYGDFGRYTFQSSLTTFDYEKFDGFNIQDLSNYAVKVIHDEYIEDIELFEKAEEMMRDISYDRHIHTVERIGKKYQWLAMYKVLAKVADNYQVSNSSWRDDYIDYEETSSLYIRNIDPTTTLKEKIKTDKSCWYTVDGSEFENIELKDNEAWLKSKDKLPSLKEIINPSIKDKYLILDSFFMKSGNKESEQYRYLMYNVHSYIVKQEEFEDTIRWAREHNFYQESIEDVGDNFDEDYLRAYPNSADDDCRVRKTRHRIHMQLERKTPHEMLKTSVSYQNEGKSYDSSVSDYINIALPTKWLINQMNLKQSLVDGEWINKNNEIVFFDPTVNTCSGASTEGVLVANKKLLLNWLEENGYVILWILNGEKDLRTSDSDNFFDDIPFIGYGGVSGYAYFDGDELIENIDVKIERPLGWIDE